MVASYRRHNSVSIRTRLEAAREVQRRRFAGTDIDCSAEMNPARVRKHCQFDEAGQALLEAAMNQLHLSADDFVRILKLARTIADLAGSESISTTHVAEAIQCRPRSGG